MIRKIHGMAKYMVGSEFSKPANLTRPNILKVLVPDSRHRIGLGFERTSLGWTESHSHRLFQTKYELYESSNSSLMAEANEW